MAAFAGITAASVPIALPAVAAQPLAVSATVAWAGVARPGLWTEIEIRVVSQRGGTVELEASPGAVPTRASVVVEAGRASRVRLPVWLDPEAAGGPLAVTASGPGGQHAELTLPLDWVDPGTRIVASAEGLLADPWPPASVADRSVRWVEANATSLPTRARVFELVDVLALDPRTLTELTPAQLAAFERRLGTCGRTVVVGVSTAAARRGAERAGCRGMAFVGVPDRAAMVAAVHSMLTAGPPPLPEARQLAEVFGDGGDRTTERALLGFFALYFAVLVAGAAARIRSWQLVAVSAGGALLLGGVLHLLPADRSTQFWVEQTTSGSGTDRTARFASLMRVATTGPDIVALRVPRLHGLPSPVLGTRPVSFEVLPARPGEEPGANVEVQLRGALLASSTLRSEGSLAWTAALTLAGDGPQPRVENTAAEPTARATLLWNGEAIAVPVLEPGDSFTPAPKGDDRIAGEDLPRWLAQRRRPAGGPRLVVAGVPAALTSERTKANSPGERNDQAGWTTIRWTGP